MFAIAGLEQHCTELYYYEKGRLGQQRPKAESDCWLASTRL